MEIPDTIKSLAKKLLAMADPSANASAGERGNALAKLKRLLDRHGLTMDDIGDTNRVWIETIVEAHEVELFQACYHHVTGSREIEWTKRKLPKKLLRVAVQFNRVERADMASCFGYYRIELRNVRQKIEREAKALARTKKAAAMAMIVKYEITSGIESGKEGKEISPARFAALMAAMGLSSAGRWEKPTGEIDSGVLALR